MNANIDVQLYWERGRSDELRSPLLSILQPTPQVHCKL